MSDDLVALNTIDNKEAVVSLLMAVLMDCRQEMDRVKAEREAAGHVGRVRFALVPGGIHENGKIRLAVQLDADGEKVATVVSDILVATKADIEYMGNIILKAFQKTYGGVRTV